MKLVVIIPAFNEEKTIGKVIKEIPEKIEGLDEIEVLVVDDGSTDNTVKVAKEHGVNKVVSNKKNLGLARTFQVGLNTALSMGSDIIVNTDADGQYNQEEIPKLVKLVLKNKSDIVIGNRQVRKLKFMKLGNRVGNLIGSWVLRKLTNSNVIDASSGFRAFSKEAALKINIFYNHTYTHESIIQAVFKNLAIDQVDIEFRKRAEGKSRLINSLYSHIKNSSLIILRTILIYKPLKILSVMGVIVIIPGVLLGIRFLYYFFNFKSSGKVQSLLLAVLLVIIGFFIVFLGLIGDLIAKNRKLNEEILYNSKKMLIDKDINK